jgi:hypothetical protein
METKEVKVGKIKGITLLFQFNKCSSVAASGHLESRLRRSNDISHVIETE